MKKIIITSISIIFSVAFNAQILNNSAKNAKTTLLNKSGKYYRVTAKGFICNRETTDDVLERDGKRDEIYLTSSAVMISTSGFSLPTTAIKNRSRTMGDINGREAYEKRAMAGTGSNLGGIKTGDQLPDVNPWKNNAKVSGDLLPFVLWEGELPENQSVVITPSIMEWDGPADFLTAFWHDSFIGNLLQAPVTLASIPYNMITGSGLNGNYDIGNYDDSTPGVFPPPTVIQQCSNFYKADFERFSPAEKEKYRKANSVDTSRPNDRPIGLDNGFYNPLTISLNAISFDRIATSDFGYGKGIIPLKYKDSSGLNGDYTVFYSFEIVTDNAEKNRINITNADAFNASVAYKFRNAFSPNYTTDLLNGGDVIVMNDDKNLQSEKWYIRKANQFYYHFINPYNNQKLGFQFNGDTQPLLAKTNGQGEEMAFIRYCDGSWIIKLSGDRKHVLQTDNLNIQLGTPVNFSPYFGGKNQRWFIEE